MNIPTLIAEIGCNHRGDLKIAKEFIICAKEFCGVNVVKFQKRNSRELLDPEQYHKPHPVPDNSYGRTYGEHREYLEFSQEQHRELKEFCEQHQIIYSTSVWDISSLKEIIALQPEFIKIPSATNQNIELLSIACSEFEGQIHLSLGMTTKKEEEAVVEVFQKYDRTSDLVLYACTSGYPIKPSEAALFEITRLREQYEGCVAGIGYSGHHNGIAIDIAACALGAQFLERHFTLDRTWKGTDHAASLEPDGLRKLNRNLREACEAMEYKVPEILPVEIPQREKLKWLKK